MFGAVGSQEQRLVQERVTESCCIECTPLPEGVDEHALLRTIGTLTNRFGVEAWALCAGMTKLGVEGLPSPLRPNTPFTLQLRYHTQDKQIVGALKQRLHIALQANGISTTSA